MEEAVFSCQRCNACCQGQGGIFLEPQEVAAAARQVGLTPPRFLEMYCLAKDGRWAVLCDERGFCRLLGPTGCRIHQAKPEVCMRWPFMTAMLKDPGAFEEAKLVCPGFGPQATHEEFLALARAQGHAPSQGV
jgi:hypothetical protein